MVPAVTGLIQFVVCLKARSRFKIDMSELYMMKVGAPNYHPRVNSQYRVYGVSSKYIY